MVGLSAVLDGDVSEAVGEVGDFFPGCCMVEGDGVAAGVGPDDADGGGAGLDVGADSELGEGDMGLELRVEVVGGVDAFASGQEGQPVGGGPDSVVAGGLAPRAGEGGLIVLEEVVETWGGVRLRVDGGVELSEEVSVGAGDVVQGDGELGATVMLDGDALGAFGDGALGLGQGTGSGGRGSGLGRGAAGGGQGDLDAPVDGAGLVAGVVDLGL